MEQTPLFITWYQYEYAYSGRMEIDRRIYGSPPEYLRSLPRVFNPFKREIVLYISYLYIPYCDNRRYSAHFAGGYPGRNRSRNHSRNAHSPLATAAALSLARPCHRPMCLCHVLMSTVHKYG